MIDQPAPHLIDTEDISHFYDTGLHVSVLRTDKIHSIISGNKWFKLRYYMEQAFAQNKKSILTFGGAWSNHIVATAAFCKLNGLSSSAIIRGEEPSLYSATLLKAKELGMHLEFLSRDDYRDKKIPTAMNPDDYYLIPEGGYGEKGAAGAATLLEHCDKNFTHYCCAVGTGTMMAGLINRSLNQTVIGISVLKNNISVEDEVEALLKQPEKYYQINHQFDFNGYAKHTPVLIAFMNEFYRQTSIPSDFVYTGKLFYGINQLIHQGYFPAASRILLIHSGGLQGNQSLKPGMLIF